MSAAVCSCGAWPGMDPNCTTHHPKAGNLTPRESQLLASLQHSTMLLASVPLLSDDAEARAHASRVALAQVERNRVVMGKCGGAA